MVNWSIPDDLAASYDRCRGINRDAGSTFYWAARLLPRPKRPHVHALYALARLADDIVDEQPVEHRATRLATFAQSFFADLERGRSVDPVLGAVVNTVVALDIESGVFRRFFRSMEMDLTITAYETWDDLLGYMDGSAAVIGEMMLAVLEPVDLAAALRPARDLGLAFQLTNFLRDIGEDLDRGRQYLPQADLRHFGVDLTERRPDADFIRLMRFEVARCRDLYASSEAGIALLTGRERRCIRAAHALYSRVLDRIEERGYDVFAGRVSLSTPGKLVISGRELLT